MTEAPNAEAAGHQPIDEHGHLSHVAPVGELLAVFAALIVLTVLTVAAAGVDLGGVGLPVAMGIATLKAALVALYFMHLRYDQPFHGFLFLVALAFLALFLLLTLLDTVEFQPEIESRQEELLSQ